MSESFIYAFDPADLALCVDDISGAMGYRGEVPPSVAKALSEVWNECAGLIAPCGGFVLCEGSVGRSGEELSAGQESFYVKKIIGSALAGSTHIAVFTATIGSAVEEKAAAYNAKGEILKMYCADVIGSEAAEKTADLLQKKISDHVSSLGMSITNRYSPGYCGWDVSAQKNLFSLLPGAFCGVTLTASSMMVPVKSVSGVIGAGQNLKVRPYGCALCGNVSCIRREHKQSI
ncbi:MAG: vitamin B12 dependent-methionine synthase activation domain-containing protein [Spirochaetota bacterium]